MIEFAGSIVAREQAPYIYLIRKGSYLYIGETQRNPIQRWSEHLQENGSFQKALRNRDEEASQFNNETEFYAYRCCRIETEVRPIEKRKVTQAIEHQLHIKFVCKGGASLELISDTKRTAPTSCQYRWVNEVVDSIFEEFLQYIF